MLEYSAGIIDLEWLVVFMARMIPIRPSMKGPICIFVLYIKLTPIGGSARVRGAARVGALRAAVYQVARFWCKIVKDFFFQNMPSQQVLLRIDQSSSDYLVRDRGRIETLFFSQLPEGTSS